MRYWRSSRVSLAVLCERDRQVRRTSKSSGGLARRVPVWLPHCPSEPMPGISRTIAFMTASVCAVTGHQVYFSHSINGTGAQILTSLAI